MPSSMERLCDSLRELLARIRGTRRNDDNPADLPQYFQDFLDRRILISFHRRQTPEQAQRTLRRYLRTSQRDLILQLADIRRVAYYLYFPGGPWPREDFNKKEKRKMSMEEKKWKLERLVGAAINEYDQKQNPNYDSDDDNIDEDEEGDGIPDYPYPIERVRRLYSKFARNEIWEAVDRGIELHEVLGIISLPHFARVSCLQYILFPFDTLKVTIGFRKVNIRIGNSQTNEESYAQYEWKRDGCIVRYPTTFYTVWGARYQSIAAKDFFSLISNPTLVLEKLEFDIEPYD
ncbi:unnamed protein product [Caenorhabditis brenneri]